MGLVLRYLLYKTLYMPEADQMLYVTRAATWQGGKMDAFFRLYDIR